MDLYAMTSADSRRTSKIESSVDCSEGTTPEETEQRQNRHDKPVCEDHDAEGATASGGSGHLRRSVKGGNQVEINVIPPSNSESAGRAHSSDFHMSYENYLCHITVKI